MGEFFAYTFVAAWFIFWAYIIATKPEVFFKFQEQGDKRLKGAARVGGKAAGVGIKVLGTILKK